MTEDRFRARDVVRERYGRRARQVSALRMINVDDALCCADGSRETSMDDSLGAFANLYHRSELDGLPLEAVAASAGCGNPAALAGLRHGERVLDLGSGGGIDCFIAALQVGKSGHVTGLDMTPDMINLARKNAEIMEIGNVEFVQGYIEDIPLADESVHVVMSNCVVCLSTDKDAVAREMFRVLIPGGRVHISDMVTLTPMPQELREDVEIWAACVSGADDRQSYRARLVRAGFTEVAIVLDGAPRTQREGFPEVTSVKVEALKPR